MRNERNAGRKPIVSTELIEQIVKRYESGESISDLAKEIGISRQALYKRIKESRYKTVRIDYIVDGEISTVIEADFRKEQMHVINYAKELSKRAFGYEQDPDWDKLHEFLEDFYLKTVCSKEYDLKIMLDDKRRFSLDDINGINLNSGSYIKIETFEENPVFEFRKKIASTALFDLQ